MNQESVILEPSKKEKLTVALFYAAFILPFLALIAGPIILKIRIKAEKTDTPYFVRFHINQINQIIFWAYSWYFSIFDFAFVLLLLFVPNMFGLTTYVFIFMICLYIFRSLMQIIMFYKGMLISLKGEVKKVRNWRFFDKYMLYMHI